MIKSLNALLSIDLRVVRLNNGISWKGPRARPADTGWYETIVAQPVGHMAYPPSPDKFGTLAFWDGDQWLIRVKRFIPGNQPVFNAAVLQRRYFRGLPINHKEVLP